jgi:hypothetical protein
MPVNRALCEQKRTDYGYPPARLRRVAGTSNAALAGHPYLNDDPIAMGWPTNPASFPSKHIDAYHQRLLHSASPQDQFDGVLSIVYWGHFAKRTGAPNPYALSRTRWMLEGKRGRHRRTVAFVSKRVRTARSCLAASSPPLRAAVDALDEIAFIGLSFASKILAFMDPERCAVLDAVVLRRLHDSNDPGLQAITKDAAGFETWCLRCQEAATALNAQGSTWTDWDGKPQRWRAVDVERAVFRHAAQGLDPADLLV